MELRVLLVVVLHCLGNPSQVLAMLHCLIVLKVITIGLSNTWQTRTVWKANLSWIGICWNLLRTLKWKILTSWCGGKWILLDSEFFPKLPVMCWLFLSLQLHPSLLLVREGVFWIHSIVHYLLIQLKPLFVPKIGWRMQRKKISIKFQECMDNVEDGFKIDTSKIYICSFCLLYVSIIYLFDQCLRIILFWMGL